MRPLPKQLVLTMASRARRMHNYLWHEVRDNWLTYPKDLQNEIRSAGWEPPRPAGDANGQPFLTNDSGEDFLFMHRQTIRFANTVLAQAGDPDYPRVEGWLQIPAPGDPEFPVPPVWFDPGEFPVITRFTTQAKSDVAYRRFVTYWSSAFSDPAFLSTLTLGHFGSMIHLTIHDIVKRRWSSVPGGRRPEPGVSVDTIPVEWDDPRYDYLGDFYSIQLNPVYWKFFGWVDDRIEEWKVAHSVFGNEFWKGRWMGKIPDAGEGAPSGLHERLEDPEVADRHAAEVESLLVAVGRSLASQESAGTTARIQHTQTGSHF